MSCIEGECRAHTNPEGKSFLGLESVADITKKEVSPVGVGFIRGRNSIGRAILSGSGKLAGFCVHPVQAVAHAQPKFKMTAPFPEQIIDFQGDCHCMNVLLSEEYERMDTEPISDTGAIAETIIAAEARVIAYSCQLGSTEDLRRDIAGLGVTRYRKKNQADYC